MTRASSQVVHDIGHVFAGVWMLGHQRVWRYLIWIVLLRDCFDYLGDRGVRMSAGAEG